MRVKCDDCPCLRLTDYADYCGLEASIGWTEGGDDEWGHYSSESCPLLEVRWMKKGAVTRFTPVELV
ncbi:MAG: hypothetical protein WC455_18940 [Dehalococcoidia bacterium]|jgi:hypothetical protein